MTPTRQICIYPKDVAAIMGIKYASGKQRLRRLRETLGKGGRDKVSVGEFCAATGLPEHEVRAALRS